MKISYDPKADALYIKFQEGTANRTRKVEEGCWWTWTRTAASMASRSSA